MLINVYDNYGKLYLREQRRLTSGESALDLSGLPRGTYQVHILRGSKATYTRITKR